MNYFTPGLAEFSRIFRRQWDGLLLRKARSDLAKAETELGLLGWQQAEFDPNTQREVDKIQNYEREQARLSNVSAEIGRKIHEMKEEREAARKAHEKNCREYYVRRDTARQKLADLETKAGELRRRAPSHERRIPELERELREASSLYESLLLSTTQTAQVREETVRLRERVVAIPNEIADARAQHQRDLRDIETLEKQIQTAEQEIRKAGDELHAVEEAFESADGERATQLRAREKEKEWIEKEINQLEGSKTNPYREIGRVLADSGVAPMNQPGALEKVQRRRRRVAEFQAALNHSNEISAAQNRQLVTVSMLLVAVTLFSVALLGALALSEIVGE